MSAGIDDARRRLNELFPTRESHLAWQLITLAQTGQPCDVTFYDRSPILDVKVDPQIALALSYGAGAHKLRELLSRIKFSDGTTVGFSEIWTVNAMPSGGIPESDLGAVNLADGDVVAGQNGETIRQIIRATYHCASRQEEDRFLRRFLAS